jgi:hypothetical protein
VKIRVSKLLTAEQQLRFTHGIHLAAHDTLLEQKSMKALADSVNNVMPRLNDAKIGDNDDMNIENGSLEVTEENVNEEYNMEAELSVQQSVVNKVRKVVKLFERSPIQFNDILRKYAIPECK